MTHYRDKDLKKFASAIATARAMAEEDRPKYHDQGTCVLGAGIAIYYIPPRCRKAVRDILIGQHFQGNVGSWNVAQRALAYLKEQGLDCFWYDGRMD